MSKNLTIGTKFTIDNVSYKIKDIQERHNIVFAEPIGVKYKKNEIPDPDIFPISQVQQALSNNLKHIKNTQCNFLQTLSNDLKHIRNTQCNFLNVDEDLNNDIDKYIDSYSGKNKEVLK